MGTGKARAPERSLRPMAAGYRLVIIRVRDQSVDGLRRAAITLERLMGIPERDAFIGLDRLPFPARGSLRIADAQLYIKALRTVGIVAQLEADGTEAGQAPPHAAPVAPTAAARPAPGAPRVPPAAQVPPFEPPPQARPAPAAATRHPAPPFPPAHAPTTSPTRAPAPPAGAFSPPARPVAQPRPAPEPLLSIDLADPPDESVTRQYPIALVEELVEQSSSDTAPVPVVEPPNLAITGAMPMASSFVIDLGEAAAPAVDLPPLDVGGLPPLDGGELPSVDLGESPSATASWDMPDLDLGEPLVAPPSAPRAHPPVPRPPPPPPAADVSPPTDIGLDLALLDEGGEIFEDLAQAQGSTFEAPALSLDDFDPLK